MSTSIPMIGQINITKIAVTMMSRMLAGMPAYVAFRRSSSSVTFEEGSWADLNIRGFRRFKRVYFDPYVPLWFVGLAVVVLFVD